MKYYNSEGLPSNTDAIVFDFSSYNLFFTSFNVITFLMFTAVVYDLYFSITLLSLKYFNSILSRSGKLTRFLVGADPSNKDRVGSITSAIGKTITIIQGILVFLFLFTMVASVYLYLYYPLSEDLAKDLNSIIVTQFKRSPDSHHSSYLSLYRL